MKKLFYLPLLLLAFPSVLLAGGNVAPSPCIERNGEVYCPKPTHFEESVAIGISNSIEGHEKVVNEIMVEDEHGNSLLAWGRTLELEDATYGTVDVIERIYKRIGGVYGMWFSSKVYTAEPAGSEAPVTGCRVRADGATWNPASVGVTAHWVWYDGDSWEAINAITD
jgi:hypothetical protein